MIKDCTTVITGPISFVTFYDLCMTTSKHAEMWREARMKTELILPVLLRWNIVRLILFLLLLFFLCVIKRTSGQAIPRCMFWTLPGRSCFGWGLVLALRYLAKQGWWCIWYWWLLLLFYYIFPDLFIRKCLTLLLWFSARIFFFISSLTLDNSSHLDIY